MELLTQRFLRGFCSSKVCAYMVLPRYGSQALSLSPTVSRISSRKFWGPLPLKLQTIHCPEAQHVGKNTFAKRTQNAAKRLISWAKPNHNFLRKRKSSLRPLVALPACHLERSPPEIPLNAPHFRAFGASPKSSTSSE